MSRDITIWSTNESLKAIVAGMEPTEKDNILAVAGSGDQAFALSEYAGRVTAVDNDPEQIRYVAERSDFLRKGDYRRFLEIDPRLPEPYRCYNRDTRRYFKNKLNSIRERLDGLEILEGDFFDIARRHPEFNKFYLSNIMGWNSDRIAEMADLPAGSLIFVSTFVNRVVVPTPHLQMDKRLTDAANVFSGKFSYGVYRKVSEQQVRSVDTPLQVSAVA